MTTCLSAQTPRQLRRDGWSQTLSLDYDGSRFRTSAVHVGAELEWGSQELWASLNFDTYTGEQSNWRLRTDSFATLQLGRALHRDNAARLYLNATINIDFHSVLASQGGDLTPEINAAWGINDEWWLGGNLGGVFATDPDEGYRRGYGYATAWLYWNSCWTPNEEDAWTLSIWAANNEDSEADNALFISLEYEFDVTETMSVNLGIGTDPISPWDHQGIFGTLGLIWRF
jgi:hypothetical protein